MRSTDYDVLVLGGAGVDTIVYVPELPLPYADSYMVPAIEMRAGQTGDGVALGLAALGLRTGLFASGFCTSPASIAAWARVSLEALVEK